MLLISFSIVVNVIKNGDFNDINNINKGIKTFKIPLMSIQNVVKDWQHFIDINKVNWNFMRIPRIMSSNVVPFVVNNIY